MGGDRPHSPGVRTPDQTVRLAGLRERVEAALHSLPVHFRSTTNIEGVQATDLFALNSLLATTIEMRVVETLNGTREVWDPDGEWRAFSFERQAQTFPDVRLVSRGGGLDVALGVELKGWYLLAKEGKPSLRMTVNPRACAPHDLVAVVPWYLSNVLSGEPTVLTPWVYPARDAAEYRNHWWTEVRVTTADPRIIHPQNQVRPYPVKADEVADKPVSDRGGNFGRLARTGLMDNFIRASLRHPIAGIAAEHWIRFFRINSEPRDHEKIDEWLARRLAGRSAGLKEEDARRIFQLVRELGGLVRGL